MPSIRIFTQPFALVTPIDILMNVLLILVIAMIAIFGLRKLLAREQNEEFRKLKTYFLMFWDGFHIVKKHIWIFLIPFFISLTNTLYFIFWNWHRFKIQKAQLSQGVIDWKPWRSFRLWSLLIRQNLARSLDYFQVNVSGIIAIVLLTLMTLFGFVYIKRYLNKKVIEPGIKESILFMKKILPFSAAIAGGISVSLVLIFTPISDSISTDKFLVFAKLLPPLIIPAFWFGSILSSLVIGAVLVVINKTLRQEEIIKSEIASETIRCFKPLFIFCLLLALLFIILHIPISFFMSRRINPTIYRYYVGIYSNFLRPLIRLLILFTPYIIIKESLKFKAALKTNFIFWKKYFAKIVIFVLCGIVVLFIPTLIYDLTNRLLRFYPLAYLLTSTVAAALLVFANLTVVAATMIFYSSVTSGKVISVKAEEPKN